MPIMSRPSLSDEGRRSNHVRLWSKIMAHWGIQPCEARDINLETLVSPMILLESVR